MLPGDVMVYSHDGALQDRPHALYRVGVHRTSNVFLQSVVHAVVLVEDTFQSGVRLVLVGVDGGPVLDVTEDLVLDVVRVVGRNGNRRHFSFPLPQSKNRLLADRSPSFFQLLGFVLVAFLSADELLIRLDDARQKPVLVTAGLLDPLQHVPGRLLRPIQFLRQLQRTDALSRDADLVHHPEPFDHRDPRGLHDGSDSA